jgi:CxxH/CxxC protein (TIGR04129 family)
VKNWSKQLIWEGESFTFPFSVVWYDNEVKSMIADGTVKNKDKTVFESGGEYMIYSCEEHIEIALDDIVDKYQTYPVLSQVPVDNRTTCCEYCEKQAVYMVANK